MSLFNKKSAGDNRKSSPSSRALKVGGYSVAVSLLAVAIAVAANLFVGELPASMTRIDLTSDSVYTLSEQTRSVLQDLDTEVAINVIAEAGSENSIISELLARYEEESGNIRIKTVDPVVSPNFVSQYTKSFVANNSLIVVSDKRHQIVDYRDMGTSSSFEGEGMLTGAVAFVVSDDLPVVYALTGHGEKEIAGNLASAVARENIDVRPLNLIMEKSVPADAACLIIFAPSEDISKEEGESILSYLDGGGRLMLVTDYSDSPRPNLEWLMAEYGVRGVKGIVVEGSAAHTLMGYNQYLLPDFAYHAITEPLREGSYYVLAPVAQGIEETGSVRSSVKISPLLQTSDSAYSKVKGYGASTLEREEEDISGPFDIAVAINERFSDKETKIVWITTSMLLDDTINSAVSGSNFDLFLNSMGWMCETKNTMTIRAKKLASEYLTIPSSHSRWWSVVLLGVLPLGFVLVGGIVWYRRRRR